jgi:hypothetical protein
MNIDPQMIQALMQSGSNDPQAARLKRQQAQADQMRQTGIQQVMSGPQGQEIGGVYQPNYANMIGGALQAYMGNKQQGGIDTAMGEMNSRNMDAKSKYMDAMMMAMRKNYPQPQSPMLPPDGMEDQ